MILIWLSAQLLRDFDFQILNTEKPYIMSQRAMFVIRDMWMRVTEREGH